MNVPDIITKNVDSNIAKTLINLNERDNNASNKKELLDKSYGTN